MIGVAMTLALFKDIAQLDMMQVVPLRLQDKCGRMLNIDM